MGNELSCTSRGKPLTLEDGFDRMIDGIEQAAETVEQAIDDATRALPARPECKLADKECAAAMGTFWQLVREQGSNVVGETPMVYEDAAMALCLRRLSLLMPPRASRSCEGFSRRWTRTTTGK